MKRFLTGILFLAALNLYASGPDHKKYRPTIQDLDRAIESSSEYQAVRENRIASKKKALEKTADTDSLFWGYADLFNEYSFYQVDSALAYSFAMQQLAEGMDDPYKKLLARLNVIEEYIQEGMYVDAKELLEDIPRASVPDNLLESYYYKFNALYEALSDYALNPRQKQAYQQKEFAYKDSISIVSPGNYYISSALLFAEGKTEQALNLLLDTYNKMLPTDRSIGPTAYVISRYYKRIGMREEEKRYLIASSISDIQCAVKEYLSLRRLAEILYEEGDIHRAHKYIMQCLADARFCNARLREIQVSQIYPVLESAYQQRLHSHVLLLSCLIAAIFILLVVTFIFLRKNKRQERALDEANRKLSEASTIKNVFISNLLLECITRIDQLDSYRKALNKKALAGDKAGVFKELRSFTFVEEQRTDFFNTFDSIFLQIVPTFIDSVNKLLKADSRFTYKGRSLSTELRILALIKLGITDSDRIASILKYSKATVYSYRSRMRLKAIDPENFEKNVAKIRTI